MKSLTPFLHKRSRSVLADFDKDQPQDIEDVEEEAEEAIEKRVQVAHELLEFVRSHEPYKAKGWHRFTLLSYYNVLALSKSRKDEVTAAVAEIVADYPYPQYDTITSKLLMSIYIRLHDLAAAFEIADKSQLMNVRPPLRKMVLAAIASGDHAMFSTLTKRISDNVFSEGRLSVLGLNELPWRAMLKAFAERPQLVDQLFRMNTGFHTKFHVNYDVVQLLLGKDMK